MTDELDAKLAAHPVHDGPVHWDSELFFMGCRRCMLLEQLRARDFPQPGRGKVETHALVLYGSPAAARPLTGLPGRLDTGARAAIPPLPPPNRSLIGNLYGDPVRSDAAVDAAVEPESPGDRA